MEAGICRWPLPCQAGIHKRILVTTGLPPANTSHNCLASLPRGFQEDTPNLHKTNSVNTNTLCNLEWVVRERVLKASYTWLVNLGETHKEGVKGDEGREGTVRQLNPRGTDMTRDTQSVPKTQELPSRRNSKKGPVPMASPFCTVQRVSMIFLKQDHP